jgi:hypothetical protein
LKGVNGVAVDEVANGLPKVGGVNNRGRGDHPSFSFGSLDPDLTALLSSNGYDGMRQSLSSNVLSPRPPPYDWPLPLLATQATTAWRINTYCASETAQSAIFSTTTRIFRTCLFSHQSQSSPARQCSSFLTRPTPSRRPSSLSAPPQLACSVTAPGTPLQQGKVLAGHDDPSPQSSLSGSDMKAPTPFAVIFRRLCYERESPQCYGAAVYRYTFAPGYWTRTDLAYMHRAPTEMSAKEWDGGTTEVLRM